MDPERRPGLPDPAAAGINAVVPADRAGSRELAERRISRVARLARPATEDRWSCAAHANQSGAGHDQVGRRGTLRVTLSPGRAGHHRAVLDDRRGHGGPLRDDRPPQQSAAHLRDADQARAATPSSAPHDGSWSCTPSESRWRTRGGAPPACRPRRPATPTARAEPDLRAGRHRRSGLNTDSTGRLDVAASWTEVEDVGDRRPTTGQRPVTVAAGAQPVDRSRLSASGRDPARIRRHQAPRGHLHAERHQPGSAHTSRTAEPE